MFVQLLSTHNDSNFISQGTMNPDIFTRVWDALWDDNKNVALEAVKRNESQ